MWITAAEVTVAACKENNAEKVKLETDLASAHKKVTQLSVLGKVIDDGCWSSKGRDVRARGDRIIKPWNFILSRLRSDSVREEAEEVEGKNINLVMNLVEESFKLGQSTNISDLWDMLKTVKQIQAAED